jgi:hypothetical protein
MSAYTDSLEEWIRRKNPTPEELSAYRKFQRDMGEISRETGFPLTGFISDDMTEEEAIMQIVENHLKEGYPLEEAEKMAEEEYKVLMDLSEEGWTDDPDEVASWVEETGKA